MCWKYQIIQIDPFDEVKWKKRVIVKFMVRCVMSLIILVGWKKAVIINKKTDFYFFAMKNK